MAAQGLAVETHSLIPIVIGRNAKTCNVKPTLG